MKKWLGKFVKPIISKENSYRLNKNELQESRENYQIEESSKLDIYKNFEFDCDCNENAVSDGSQKEIETPINLLPGLNTEAVDFKCKKEIYVLSSADKKNIEGHSERNGSDWVNSDCKNASRDDVFLEVEEKIKSLKPDEKEVQKTKGSTYVINIRDSKNFFVGSLKTINVGHPGKDDVSELRWSNNWSSGMGGIAQDYLDSLFDSEENLTEGNITLISMYLDHRWKDFGKSLGFEELFLEELEQRYDGKTSIVVYDFLHKYLNDFPKTSLGFVAYVLNKIQSTNVIEKLAVNKRC